VPVRFLSCEPLLGPLPSLNLDGISWVIVGGESGPYHRPVESDWARQIRDLSVGGHRILLQAVGWKGRVLRVLECFSPLCYPSGLPCSPRHMDTQ
jgi:protein gp37